MLGKMGGSSWLSAVKKAFRSPTKESGKRSSRRRDCHEQEEEEKKSGKRRWIFRKSSNHETIIHHCEAKTISTATNITANSNAGITYDTSEAADAKERHALAVAMATTAAAQAAVATAQAAVEVVRLTRPSIFVKQHFAAIAIQTAFRGYLARRALRALKGLVQLQALVRGHNVRNRAKTTLQCMQAMARVQARVQEQRRRVSYEGSTNSISSDQNSLWGSHFAERKSISRDESSNGDDWIHCDYDPKTLEEIQSMLPERKEVAIKREKALAYAFSEQIWKPGRDAYASEGEVEEKPRLLDMWRTRKEWESRSSFYESRSDPVKTVKMDTSRPHSYSTPNALKLQQYHHQQQRPSSYSAASPIQRNHINFSIQPVPVTPSPSKIRTMQVHSVSPRCLRDDRNHVMEPSTPNAASMPNYMAATASAKARNRSQSTPRHRPSTPEREKTGSARKRLSFLVLDQATTNSNGGNMIEYSLRSPRYKGINQVAHGALEQKSNMSSCCTDSIDDEVSPPSTNDLSRWLR